MSAAAEAGSRPPRKQPRTCRAPPRKPIPLREQRERVPARPGGCVLGPTVVLQRRSRHSGAFARKTPACVAAAFQPRPCSHSTAVTTTADGPVGPKSQIWPEVAARPGHKPPPVEFPPPCRAWSLRRATRLRCRTLWSPWPRVSSRCSRTRALAWTLTSTPSSR